MATLIFERRGSMRETRIAGEDDKFWYTGFGTFSKGSLEALACPDWSVVATKYRETISTGQRVDVVAR